MEQQQQGGQVPAQALQKCPRCESLNTKFCYFNNYSMSQPRHYCKACRRYWTHGGTLRNVPVGGASRKGKRANKNSSGAVQQQQQPVVPAQPPMVTASARGGGNPSPYGGGGGYMAAIHNSMNQPQSYPTFDGYPHQSVMNSSNLGGGILSGFNVAAPVQQQMMPLYGVADQQGGLVPSQNVWPNQNHTQSYMNYNNSGPDVSHWSTIMSTTSISQGSASAASPSLINNNQWPNLPGYNKYPPLQ